MTIMLDTAEAIHPGQLRKATASFDRPIMICLLVFLVVGVLDPAMALAAVSWMAWRGNLDVAGNWLAFLSHRWAPWAFSLAVLPGLVVDPLVGPQGAPP